jgi:mono/diheme cytochrome c family protein
VVRTDKFLVAFFSLLIPGCLFTSPHSGGHGHSGEHNMDTVTGGLTAGPVNQQWLFTRGEAIYGSICSHCHQMNGLGIPDSIPPLANSNLFMADRLWPIRVVLKGLGGPIVVNGIAYNDSMPPIKGSDTSVAAVLTYVRNHFNGATDSIGVQEVTTYRQTLGPVGTP